ncbi:MAG: ABC transporter substrate-binding protein, partial [Planctomycetota bacterium]
STSAGADALLVSGEFGGIADLKDTQVAGLEKSVSEYTFRRLVELGGGDPDEFNFVNMPPEAAAQAMQAGSADVPAIVVWNPFVLQTLKTTPGVTRLGDSSSIPGEIIDMVVAQADSLEKPGADRFVAAVAEAYYTIAAELDDDETLAELGALFGGLDADDMRVCVTETQFYATPAAGVELFEGDTLPASMDLVLQFSVDRELVGEKPTVGYGDGAGNLRFDPSYMKQYSEAPAE